MVNRINKFLSKLNKSERKKVDEAIDQLLINWQTAGDIKALKGFKNTFRLRVGRVRIVFQIEKEETFIISIGLRDDRFYEDLKT